MIIDHATDLKGEALNVTDTFCPCCSSVAVDGRCTVCGHVWKSHPVHVIYSDKVGRNKLPTRYFERKLAERLAALEPKVHGGMNILEIGCAEGEMGGRLKAIRSITYWGIEPSLDANLACHQLDAVYSEIREIPAGSPPFDAILSFHVLEHIHNPREELMRWQALLSSNGWIMLEVPYRAGHPDICEDGNFEHIHQFAPASLLCLLEQSGFDLITLTRSHYESPVYPDSLRVLAIPRPTQAVQRKKWIKRFDRLPAPFACYGIGGDFNSYILPVLNDIPVKLLFDARPRSSSATTGLLPVLMYGPQYRYMPILICSLRYENSILSDLIRAGHPPELIYLLADICDGF